MAQISVEIICLPGSLLRGNLQITVKHLLHLLQLTVSAKGSRFR